ncbi:16S rRNA (guanine(527)-N(7))-methyltransferase RsmG [Geomonas nitrogeniifigens]|uniref:Ribosomal RNA small subunit methyltransferase G n=1 Tax=Geomonas diazotrophica TaxID=2843197 RepID=A0ABX8JGB6_9BACT|nr:16S rRNA (guanine(527)-N(7))-methyltransferase RsmG [Geomonas nitrogeniifigens]QWV97368.1 16S rRNA (guanine(527)-N(7))-methyltransferase RsmG [Geomonas nitrogeniifigens]QXE86526.1 16S rRNA (guanine(527)-N(7))-methyltransferase RsmG [Geomonas nitrogeniifigens]
MNQHAKDLLKKGAVELGLELTPVQLNALDLFAEELKKWNRKINLTAINDDEGIAVKHLVDSLSLLKVVRGPGRLLDIGSGGGFPGIPVKLVHPDLEIVSVDAVVKKISFQKQAVRLLNLGGFDALHVRAETLAAQYAGYFDWVVSRAFSDIPSFVAMALPVLKDGGRIVAMKGKSAAEEVAAAEAELEKLGVRVESRHDFNLPCSGDARSLVVLAKK